ncbi:MAG: hypothetical protein ACLPVO_14120 [Desulfomonilaceae bacterium]
MRKYSPLLGLMIIVTGMMTLQVRTQEVGASSSTTIFQCGQADLGSGEPSGIPDLKTVDWSNKMAVDNQGNNYAPDVMLADADDEGHGSEAGEEAPSGGFDRLWDVVSNG